MSKKYKINVLNQKTGENVIINADADQPAEGPGESGSILSELVNAGLTDYDVPHDCGGHLSCCSCAAKVISGKLDNTTPREEELDMIDLLQETDQKRLMCQARPDGSSDITVIISDKNTLK